MRVLFHEKEYELIGDLAGGALAQLHQVDGNGIPTFDAVFGCEDSFAHLFEDGKIRRYGDVIGSREDLTVL